jgi:hypothetical protein
MMKRILFILASLWMIALTAGAVEKIKTNKVEKEKGIRIEKISNDSGKTAPVDAPKDKIKSNTPPAKTTHDNFIDNNGDGIDDRVQKKKKKKTVGESEPKRDKANWSDK